MERDEFIQTVLEDEDNTVFTNAEQVRAVLDLFERLGMQLGDKNET